jgi:hypothetical protein
MIDGEQTYLTLEQVSKLKGVSVSSLRNLIKTQDPRFYSSAMVGHLRIGDATKNKKAPYLLSAESVEAWTPRRVGRNWTGE